MSTSKINDNWYIQSEAPGHEEPSLSAQQMNDDEERMQRIHQQATEEVA